MPDIVGRREANGQVVRDFVLPELFRVDQGLRESEREVIASRTQGKSCSEVFVLVRTIRRRKDPAITGKIGLPRLVIGVAELVRGFFVQQFPRLAGIRTGQLLLIPLVDPSRSEEHTSEL